MGEKTKRLSKAGKSSLCHWSSQRCLQIPGMKGTAKNQQSKEWEAFLRAQGFTTRFQQGGFTSNNLVWQNLKQTWKVGRTLEVSLSPKPRTAPQSRGFLRGWPAPGLDTDSNMNDGAIRQPREGRRAWGRRAMCSGQCVEYGTGPFLSTRCTRVESSGISAGCGEPESHRTQPELVMPGGHPENQLQERAEEVKEKEAKGF